MNPGRMSLAALGLLLAVLAGPGAGAQRAAGGAPETGVWWLLQTESGGLPPPPVVVDRPDGGLWLNSGPNGDQALSAMRFEVSTSEVAERVVLRVHQDSSTPGLAVALCAPEGRWEAPESDVGAWANRAVPDCERFQANGVVDDAGERVTFELSGYAPGETVDLVLTRPPSDTESYISATFKAPKSSDLEAGPVVSSGGFDAPGFGGLSGEGSASFEGPESFGSAGFEPSFGGGTGAFGTGLAEGADAELGAQPQGDGPAANFETATPQLTSSEEPWWDATRIAALIAFGVLATWIAAIVSRRLEHGAAATGGGSFTLYRGTPPRS